MVLVDHTKTKTILRKFYAGLGLLVLILLPIAALIFFQKATVSRTLTVGDYIPELQLTQLSSGDTLIIGARNSRTAILFFSINCPHCKKEIEHWDQLQREFKNKVKIYAISMSDRERTRALVNEKALSLDVAVDETEEASSAFGVAVVPTIFLVGKAGMIERRQFGESTITGDRQMLERFLQETTAVKLPETGNESKLR